MPVVSHERVDDGAPSLPHGGCRSPGTDENG
jgi:hypothetical protein